MVGRLPELESHLFVFVNFSPATAPRRLVSLTGAKWDDRGKWSILNRFISRWKSKGAIAIGVRSWAIRMPIHGERGGPAGRTQMGDSTRQSHARRRTEDLRRDLPTAPPAHITTVKEWTRACCRWPSTSSTGRLVPSLKHAKPYECLPLAALGN